MRGDDTPSPHTLHVGKTVSVGKLRKSVSRMRKGQAVVYVNIVFCLFVCFGLVFFFSTNIYFKLTEID